MLQVSREKFPTRLAQLIIAALVLLISSASGAGEGLNSQQEAEKWEEIAIIRLEAARGHELQAESKREEAFRTSSLDGSGAAGDALDNAGDEKYLASDDYQKASRHWQKAAKAHRATGDPDKAKSAEKNANKTWEAAKRTLHEGADLYKMAEEQFENIRNLEKRIKALNKLARNIERLMEMR
jgi:tetratricopeptide (TPR) repeat protein